MSTFPDDLASIQINPSITDILIQGRRSAAKLLTKDEARGIAANIAKLPELLQQNWQRPS